MPIPKGKLEPQVAITLLKFSVDFWVNSQEGTEKNIQETFNMLCDLYKRETQEDLIHG